MRSSIRLALLALSVVVALAVAGCGARSYMVVRQVTPNALAGVRSFSVEPVHFEGLQVGGMLEPEWFATKTPDQQASYMADREAMVAMFLSRLATREPQFQIIAGPPPTPQTLIIRPILTYIEPGSLGFAFRRDTEARMQVQILSASGQLLDEIAVVTRVTANLYNPASGGRLRTAAIRLSDHVRSYLNDRTGVH